MLISVIIPSYNRAETVGQTIDSILAQQVDADVEIVIGDDCSTDNAREVLACYKEKYPDKINLILHEKNVGLGANWAICVKACRGKYICNCDNDDYWHNPHKLQLQLDYMESHLESNVLITNHRNLNRKTGQIKEVEAYINRKIDFQEAIRSDCAFCNATVMYRTDFLVSHINLDDYIKYQFTLQDWNTWFILAGYTNFDVLPISTATYTIDTDSITRPASYEAFVKRMNKERECSDYCYRQFPDKYQPDSDEVWNELVNMRLLSMAYKRKDFASARKYAKLINSKSVKVRCANNRFLFYLFVFLKTLKNKICA